MSLQSSRAQTVRVALFRNVEQRFRRETKRASILARFKKIAESAIFLSCFKRKHFCKRGSRPCAGSRNRMDTSVEFQKEERCPHETHFVGHSSCDANNIRDATRPPRFGPSRIDRRR